MSDFVVIAASPMCSPECAVASVATPSLKMKKQRSCCDDVPALAHHEDAEPHGSSFDDDEYPVVNTCDGAEFTVVVDRESYFKDILRGFQRGGGGKPCSASAAFLLDGDLWSRVFAQFERDIHRQLFCVDDVVHRDADAAWHHVRRLVLQELRILRCVTKERDRMHDAKHATSLMSSLWNSCKAAWPVVMRGVSLGGAGETSGVQPAQKLFVPAFTAEELEGILIDDTRVDRIVKRVILLSQQAALAFPLELMQAHMTALNPHAWRCVQRTTNPAVLAEGDGGAPAGESVPSGPPGLREDDSDMLQVEVTPVRDVDMTHLHHVGEWSSQTDPIQQRTRIVVSSTQRGGLTVTLSKCFRVFCLDDDGVDHNLRSVKLELTTHVITQRDDTDEASFDDDDVDVEGDTPQPRPEESVVLRWWIRDATDTHQGKVEEERAVVVRTASSPQLPISHPPRCCECLGASAGIHRLNCDLRTVVS